MSDVVFDRIGWREDFGQRLALARKQRDLTQEDVADRVGIGRPTLANIEMGRQSCAVDLCWRLAIVLGVSLERLVPQATTGSTPPAATPDFTYYGSNTASTDYWTSSSAGATTHG